MNKLKRFIKYYGPYKHIFIFDMLCAFTAAGVDLIFPIIVRFLINDALVNIDGTSINLIIKIGLFLLVLYFIQYGCNYFITAWGHIMGARMEYDMRNDIFNHLQKLSFTFYDNNKTGQLMSRIVNDLFDISELAHHGPEEIFISLIKIIGSFIILLSVEWRLTIIVFAFVPPMFFIAYFYNKKMRRVFLKNKQKIANVNSQIEDSISGVRVVQSFSNEHLEYEKFKYGNKEFLYTKEESYSYMGKFYSGIVFFQGLIFVVTVIAGALFIKNGSIVPADLVAYLLYINTLLNPIRSLINFTEQFQKGMTGFERFLEVLDTEPDIVDVKDAVELENIWSNMETNTLEYKQKNKLECMQWEYRKTGTTGYSSIASRKKFDSINKGTIEFKDVSFKYVDSNLVLENINLKVDSGDTVALVGPSGGGKSTLCSLIPRFYDVTNGGVFIDGADIRKIKLNSLRRNIGIVQQDVYLFAGTVKDNIRYGKPHATEEEITEASKKANAHDFITELEDGYDTDVGERGVKLSGGQKQRISIARAFLKNPPILILDEATSSLDNESEKIVQESLEKLSSSRTTFVIAHRLSTIRNAKTILVLTDEGIVEKGNHKKLIEKNGVYAKLYKSQFKNIERVKAASTYNNPLLEN